MSYYGPQRGDYYGRGDPGFLSDVWKGIKGVAGAIIGVPRPVPQQQQFAMTIPTTFPGGMTGPAGGALTEHAHPLIGPPLPNGACCPSGYHLAKTGPFAGQKCVKNRRMDVCNARALRRAIRRVSGFEKLAKRTFSFTNRSRIRKKV